MDISVHKEKSALFNWDDHGDKKEATKLLSTIRRYNLVIEKFGLEAADIELIIRALVGLRSDRVEGIHFHNTIVPHELLQEVSSTQLYKERLD